MRVGQARTGTSAIAARRSSSGKSRSAISPPEVGLVRRHVEVTVAAERGEDRARLAGLLAAQGLPDRGRDRVRRLGRRHDPLGARERHRGAEALQLRDRLGLHEAELVDVGDQRCHAVVAQPAGVDRVGDEPVAQRVHLHQRRHADGVAEVVAVLAAGQRRAGGRLDAADHRVHPAGQLLAEEREGQAREVGAAAGAAHDHVGHLLGHLQLQQRLLADHRLVQQHVVEHAAQRVAGVVAPQRRLDRLRDRDAQRPGRVGVLGEHRAAGLGEVRRAGVQGGAVDLHHRAARGLLVVGAAHLPHLAVHAVLRGRERQRRAPLAGAGLGGEPADALLVVVPGLRHRGVGLVRPGGADPLVLEEDLRGGVEQLLQPAGPDQRGGPPQAVDVEHAARDVDVLLGGDLLLDQRHREERGEVLGPDRLVGAGVQRRWRRRREVGHDVVPLRRDLGLVEEEGRALGHHAGHLGLRQWLASRVAAGGRITDRSVSNAGRRRRGSHAAGARAASSRSSSRRPSPTRTGSSRATGCRRATAGRWCARWPSTPTPRSSGCSRRAPGSPGRRRCGARRSCWPRCRTRPGTGSTSTPRARPSASPGPSSPRCCSPAGRSTPRSSTTPRSPTPTSARSAGWSTAPRSATRSRCAAPPTAPTAAR